MGWADGFGSGLLQGAATLTSAILQNNHNRKMYDLAEQQLKETKAMNTWEKEKYNNTLKNQGEAIGTLGNAFGSVLDKSKAKPQEQEGLVQDEKLLPTERM
ncbi:hypothetical protein LS68_009245 [Helicobacter sp. MIT 05-5293]|uniref:hypothetical protein n=1 Tax=unclassified Helicobacter TaxID=2593540 RepID=UPI00051D6101|nr:MULTISPECIES: hypothetical protein [unclassified Helicobacter]TLD79846.1 hypothetical protein LS68_009245 [Helicobacter sp. MIT 05-5293]TLD85426.1 hypothetical protein LS69_009615 [Helicobacter sp. MIT 05-5294]